MTIKGFYIIILHFALCILHFVSASAQTQTPLYIVNGVEMESVKHIPEKNIEHIDHLEANEATVAKYGERANNGVIIVTLRYDKEAQFTGDKPLADYVAERVKWNESWGVARYVTRYTIEADGSFRLGTELESTDRQFRKRVLKVLQTLPKWQPATKQGKAVESDYVSERVKWNESWGVARYVTRYTIEADGSFRLGTELESTDRQFRKRVLKVLQSLPAWQPATKQGWAVESDYVLAVQLPRGKAMPKEPYIVIR